MHRKKLTSFLNGSAHTAHSLDKVDYDEQLQDAHCACTELLDVTTKGEVQGKKTTLRPENAVTLKQHIHLLSQERPP